MKSREKNLLYLNCEDCFRTQFSVRYQRITEKSLIKTGEKIRVVSDGEKGFVFNLSRT